MEKEQRSTELNNDQPPPYSSTMTETRSTEASIPPDFLPVHGTHPHPNYHVNNYPHYVNHTITQQPGPTVRVIPGRGFFGQSPRTMMCTCCNQTVLTKIVKEPGLRTHIVALSLCLAGCWPCALCPYFMDPCLHFNHYCPNCNSLQGTHVIMYL